MQISELVSTERFVLTPEGETQLLEVGLVDPDGQGTISVFSGGVVVGTASCDAERVEVPLTGLTGQPAGSRHELRVEVSTGPVETISLTVAEPGWTVWMIPHFHYDPVWWNTQAAYTALWDELPGQAQQFRQAFQQTGFALVDAHLDTARRDPDYKFVLAEVDYLKPYWDARPEQRGYLRRLLDEGRVEIMGGTYNEPNTNLTTTETTIRNFVHGIGFQRDVLGGDPHTAWQLDVFGHDPQFPGLAAEAGLTSSSWARGPHHQWGPMLTQPRPESGWGDPSVMQFPAEFEWISPSGKGVLTHYMPAHYSAGWQIDSCTTLADAQAAVYELFVLLKRVAATRNVLLPVGTDYTPPSKWVTDVQRDWNARYSSPRFETAIPRDFFAAVRAELAALGRRPAPQTRDMNPVYTGKDVSFIDTKQAQRATESMLVDAEMFAAIASQHGATYPHATLDKAWRQLVFGAHHDAITGSESDQVYLDLLTGWREAHDLGRDVLRASLDHLAEQLPGATGPLPVTVFNPSAWTRHDLVTIDVVPESPVRGLQVLAPDGGIVPSVVEHAVTNADGAITAATVRFVADAVPGIGHSAGWSVRASEDDAGWRTDPSATASIESDRYLVEVDRAAGGAVRRLIDKRTGRQVVRAGALGNELVLEQEYSAHPEYKEGPWHLVPTGTVLARSSDRAADSVVVETSPVGRRIVVSGRLGELGYTQTITLRNGSDRVDCRTSIDGFTGADQLVRVCWAADVPGALPASDVGSAVIGRGFAFRGTDVAEHPWTLDNPAVNWFALSSTARVRVSAPAGESVERAIGIAELVAADHDAAGELREVATALAGQGVTATTSIGAGSRYGRLAIDSNLPDVRFAFGGPDDNPFTAQVLDNADEQYRIELDKQLAGSGTARVWVPAARALTDVWQPSADLSGPRDLPVLIVVGAAEQAALIDDLVDATIEVTQSADASTAGEPALDDFTVAVLNTGLPSFNVDTDGTLTMAVLRSCTGWPSGVWIDPPRRTAPDGSNFQQQHWTHHYDYAIIAGPGDWRANQLVRAGHEFNHPLRTSQAGPTGDAVAPGRYLTLDGAADGDVVIAAVKASGNPIAQGREPEPVDGLTVRLIEARGATQTCTLGTSFASGPVSELDLIEQHRGELSGPVELSPMQVATVRLAVPIADGGTALVDERDPHQPSYARYWLDNTGPAPIGAMPVAVHVEPQLVEYDGAPFELTVSVASERSDATVDTTVQLFVPDSWSVEPASIPVSVPPGGHVQHTVAVRPDGAAQPGTWWVRSRIDVGGHTVEDVARVLVGDVVDREFDVVLDGPGELVPGGEHRLTATVTNHARTAISGRVQLISPWHTWALVGGWDTGVTIEPGGSEQVHFPVQIPAGADAGTWWALCKVAIAGVVHYTEPVALRVHG